MDRGRAARGGQKPTTPTTRLMRIREYRCLLRHSDRAALHDGEGRGAEGEPASRHGTWRRHQGGSEGASRQAAAEAANVLDPGRFFAYSLLVANHLNREIWLAR
jgi:hypothetical protein